MRTTIRIDDGLPDLPVFGGSGTMPGVDIADNAALRDLMDEHESFEVLR